MTRVLVTGASGFVGKTLCELLTRAGYVVRAALRSERPLPACVAEKAVTGDMAATANLTATLEGVDAIIHAAARTHALSDASANAELYMQINGRGTVHWAEAGRRPGSDGLFT